MVDPDPLLEDYHKAFQETTLFKIRNQFVAFDIEV